MRGRLVVVASFASLLIGGADATDSSADAILAGGEINSSTVAVGAFVVVVYGQGEQHPTSGEWAKLDTARGYIKAVNQRRLIVGLEPDGWSKWIALEHTQSLVLVGSPSPDAIARANALATASIKSATVTTPFLRSGTRDDTKGSGKRIAFKLVSGTLSGIGVSLGGLFLSSGAGVRGWGPIIWSVLIGYPVGSAIGVSLVDPHDRFIHSLIGSLLGVVVAASATSDINLLVFPPICATLASEMYRTPPKPAVSPSI